MTLTFWLIAASLGLVSAGLFDPTIPDHDRIYLKSFGIFFRIFLLYFFLLLLFSILYLYFDFQKLKFCEK